MLQLHGSPILRVHVGVAHGMWNHYFIWTLGLECDNPLQGADISHVICSPAAAIAIKSYSPDLIVNPILREDQYVRATI